MEDLEKQIQKQVIEFCQFLPIHLSHWKLVLQESNLPTKALNNYSEQLRHIEKSKITYINNFDDEQSGLQFKILKGIDTEMMKLKDLILKLNQTNQNLKNKLVNLEKLTVNLKWDGGSSLLIRGNAFQPPLSKLLQNGLELTMIFINNAKSINQSLKDFDARNEKSINNLENCLNPNLLLNEQIYNFIALTQYVNNNKFT